MPAVRVVVEKTATPLLFRLELPICVLPSMKVTVPVMRLELPEETLAVRVTLSLMLAAAGAAVNEVVVSAA